MIGLEDLSGVIGLDRERESQGNLCRQRDLIMMIRYKHHGNICNILLIECKFIISIVYIVGNDFTNS